MALYLTSQNEPTQSGAPIVRGRGYQLTAGVDLDGWRPEKGKTERDFARECKRRQHHGAKEQPLPGDRNKCDR